MKECIDFQCGCRNCDGCIISVGESIYARINKIEYFQMDGIMYSKKEYDKRIKMKAFL